MIFLIAYDTKSGKLLESREFSDDAREQALHALQETQESYFDRLTDIEVALFEAYSRATLEKTHSRYFRTLSELSTEFNAGWRRIA